ncbi:LuxR C-terminal-related transcriptional regulator [Microbacterium sp. NPDC087665]|uniref:helix-turn-helix transcriptional regulator n=1 Tax=Microbacterium sp. NPDC087665 TaxID=3364194 RepID=UPI0038090993
MQWLSDDRARVLDEVKASLDEQRWGDFGALIDDYFFALSVAEPDALIAAWPRVPADWLAENPRYQLASAWTRAAWRSAELVEERVERTFTRWVLDHETPAVRDTLCAHAMDIRRNLVSGRFTRANDAADDVQRVIRDAGEQQGFDDILGMILIHVGLARLVVGDLAHAAEAFSEGWRWSASGLPHPITPYLAGYCALAHALAGDNARADEWLARSSVPVESNPHGMAFRLQIAGGLAEALVAIGRLDRASAEAALARIPSGIESGDLWWVGTHVRARIALIWGDRARAVRHIDGELNAYPSLTPPSSLAGALFRADLSDIHQSLGDLDAAGDVLDAVRSAQPDPFLAASAARFLMVRGRTTEAAMLLARSLQGQASSFTEPSRWRVLRANLAHLTRAAHRAQAIRSAAEHLERTQAFDAAHDALPVVYEALTEHTRIPTDATARFTPPPLISLTPREKQVLGLLAAHASVQEIAEAMHISRNTAKTHLRALYRKLGVSTRAGALEAAGRFR